MRWSAGGGCFIVELARRTRVRMHNGGSTSERAQRRVLWDAWRSEFGPRIAFRCMWGMGMGVGGGMLTCHIHVYMYMYSTTY